MRRSMQVWRRKSQGKPAVRRPGRGVTNDPAASTLMKLLFATNHNRRADRGQIQRLQHRLDRD